MQRKPLIKGNLPRLRHFLYQIFLWPTAIAVALIARIMTTSEWATVIVVLFATCLATVYYVQRLHDAGYSGIWVLACFVVNISLDGVALFVEDPLVKWLVIRGIGAIPWIIVCILPSKRENNPWIQPPASPEEEPSEQNHDIRQKSE